jgi:hypothetical protein
VLFVVLLGIWMHVSPLGTITALSPLPAHFA